MARYPTAEDPILLSEVAQARPAPAKRRDGRPSLRVAFSPEFRATAVVVAVTLAALCARLALSPILADDSAFLTCIIAVMLGSRYGGLRAGIAATVLSAVSAWFLFLRPYRYSSAQDPAYLVQIGLFVLIGLMVSAVNEAWHRARRRLSAHEEFLSSILEATPTGVLVLDAQGYVTFVNSAAAALFGLGRGLLVGRPCREIGLWSKADGSGAKREIDFEEVLAAGASEASFPLIVEDAAAVRLEVVAKATKLPSSHLPAGVVLSLIPAEATHSIHV